MDIRRFLFFLICACSIILIHSPLTAEEFPFLAEVTTDNINIRSDTTVSSEPICKVNKGSTLRVSRELYDWYRVSLPIDAPCFIFQKYLDSTDDNTGKVNADNVNIRLRPDKSAPILARAEKDSVFKIIEKVTDWYRIEPPENAYGWINKKFVVKVSAAPEPIKAAVEEKRPKQINKEEDLITYEGILDDSGKILFFSGTHKLVTDNKETYLLKGGKRILNQAAHKRVKVYGRPEQNYKGKFPLITVDKIEIME